MRGTYVFKQSGEIVGTSTNIITAAGQREILRYLAGHRSVLGGAIGVGVGTTAPTTADTRLVLEFDRSTVELGVPDFDRSLVIFKATLPTHLEGSIHEVGLWSNPSTLNPVTNILAFDRGFETWANAGWSSGFTRLNGEGMRMTVGTNATATATLSPFAGNLTTIAPNDEMTFSFFANDSNTVSVRLRFLGASDSTYYEITFTNVQRGYNIYGFLKSGLTRVGTLLEGDITRVQVSVTSKTTDDPLLDGEVKDYTGARVILDRLLARPANSDDYENILISRSVPDAPVIKRPVAPMEIEYYLEFGTA